MQQPLAIQQEIKQQQALQQQAIPQQPLIQQTTTNPIKTPPASANHHEDHKTTVPQNTALSHSLFHHEEKKSFFAKLFPQHKIKDARKDATKKEATKKPLFGPREKQKKERLQHRKLLRKYLDRAGYDNVNENSLTKKIFNIALIICVVLTAMLLFFAVLYKPGIFRPTLLIIGLWTGVFALILIVSFFFLYLFLDLRMFQRTQAIEEVLPDFLQLTSANISAGMPLDRALFYAVRPQFGILAKEIEDIAKATTAGEDLADSLNKFVNKYDSVMLKRSVNLILEGMNAGGEMADLLNKIAINIQELRLMRREMAANVTTYVIFITFATLIGAPMLFALSTTLAVIIQQVVSGIDISAATGSLGVAFNFNAQAVNIRDFKIFSMCALAVTSIFSACIVNTIRKGSIKEGIEYIPIFIGVTISLYFLGVWILGLLFQGFF
jgi:Flp pilus assembly protein TadB